MTLVFYAVVGLVAATFGSLVGLGGGIVIVPALVYLGPWFLGETVPVATAVGTSMAVLVCTALTSTLTFVRQRRVDFKSGWLYAAASGPGAMLGATMTNWLAPASFQLYFGLFMLLMAILLIVRGVLKPLNLNWRIRHQYTDETGVEHTYGYSLVPALLLGFSVGLISGLFGIGGGSLFVPAMVLLFRYPPHVATATSMFVIFLSSLLGAITHARLGEVDWWMAAGLAPSALIGGWLGAQITSRLSTAALMHVLRVTFVLVALRMIYEGIAGS